MFSEAQNELLDAEFRQILYMIKPLINDINNHYHLEHYRLWLERLSSVYPTEKLERNKYLLLLANQIHDNVLTSPFTNIPPNGLLPPLGKLQTTVPDKSDETDASEQDDPKPVQWPCASPRRSQVEENSKPKKLRMLQPFQKIGKSLSGDEQKSETSSWCDLSESVSPVETDAEDHKMNLIEQAKEILKTQEALEQKENAETDGNEIQVIRRPTQQELEALKMRMKDLLEVKHALRDTQCLTENRKKTIEDLKLRLVRTEQENIEFRTKLLRAEQQIDENQTLLESQQKRFLDMDHIKAKELNTYKEKFTILRRKEIDSLQEHHKAVLATLEKKHSSKVSELEAQISSLKTQYEDKIKEIKDSNMSLIKEKEDQIQQLQSELKVRSSQCENEGNGEQIHTLRRCISKLDKALHKNEKDYVKKIERLKQELEVKDMASQMQLQTQRADLLIKNSTTKQEDLKHALNSLEGKYKKMMETVQSHAIEVKKQDDKLIESLKGLLQKNNIAC